MKYWCYYANVVRYLEKVEALLAPITRGPAYLVWTDDDGPHMIAGPGIHWYRGDGPMPDLDSLEIPVSITAPIGAARVSKRLATSALSTRTRRNTPRTASKRSPANAQSTRPARQCRATTCRKPTACRVEPPARHNAETSVKPAKRPPKKANKRRTTFPKPAQTCSPRGNGGNGTGNEDRARIKDLYSSNPGSGVEGRDGGKKEKGVRRKKEFGSSGEFGDGARTPRHVGRLKSKATKVGGGPRPSRRRSASHVHAADSQ